MRPLARFAAQLRVRVGARDRRLIRASPLRRPTRARLGERELGRPRQRRRLCLGRLLLARLVDSDKREARAQAGKRRVRLGVEAVDRQVRALDQTVLLAELERAQEQPLEQRPVDEAARLGVRERLVDGQPLVEAVAEEAAQIEAQTRDPAQLARRADPLQRGSDHQLDQHDRVDRRAADIIRVVPAGRLAHERPVDQTIELPVPAVLRHQLVEADHRHLQSRLLPLHRPHRHPGPLHSTRSASRA